MTTTIEPTIGHWYRDLIQHELFQVVDINSLEESIEVQYVDGLVESIDFERWYEMELEQSTPPADYSDMFEETDFDTDDYSEIY